MIQQETEWPWQYQFPPFFTLQPQQETRQRQVTAWKSLILEHCKANKICIIDIQDIAESPLFSNKTINRTLDPKALNIILKDLQKSGYASPLDKQCRRYEIYWHTLDEFSSIIYNFIKNNNYLDTVLTLFELTESELVKNEAFYKLDVNICIKTLRLLELEDKCELIMFDDNQGVKFF